MFDRFISIDWSGAGTETDRGDLRVVEADFHAVRATIVHPTMVGARAGTTRWTREECRWYLAEALREDQSRCLVAMDFGFGYPWGADGSIFGAEVWRTMLETLAGIYAEEGTARGRTAERINLLGEHGPYRFDRDRTDFRFYLDCGISYYRLVEMAVPQAISQWYLGSGGTVGFSTITGMAALDHLITRRDMGDLDFQVWPQEGIAPDEDKHVIVESYPAIYPKLSDYGECRDEHCRDAWRVLQWMLGHHRERTLGDYFDMAPMPFGRVEGVSFKEQVRFEGWIFGVR